MDPTTLLLARSFAIIAGGLFSWSMIDLVVTGNIRYYLADQKFKYLVLAGGVMLAVLVLLKLRALALATHGHHHHDHDHHHDHGHDHHHEPGHEHGHGHPHHEHGPGCEHEHEHECCHAHGGGHDHGQGEEGHVHEHGVSVWRYIVLAVPLIIILGDMAPQGLSADILTQRMSKEQMEAIASVGNATLPEGRVADGEVTFASIKQIQDAAHDPQQRDYWQSNERPVRAKTVGQFVPDARYDNRYRLMRIKITCCAADATPVGITVMGSIDPRWQHGEWLEVVGPVSFFEVPNARTGVAQYFAVVHQQQVEQIPAPSDLYLQ